MLPRVNWKYKFKGSNIQCFRRAVTSLGFLLSDQDDPPEPNLAEYAALDMAALGTVREIGSRYCLSLEALLQSTPGITTGYLPEETAKETLIGVSIPHLPRMHNLSQFIPKCLLGICHVNLSSGLRLRINGIYSNMVLGYPFADIGELH